MLQLFEGTEVVVSYIHDLPIWQRQQEHDARLRLGEIQESEPEVQLRQEQTSIQVKISRSSPEQRQHRT